jgi:hypothetical protein
MFYLTFQNSLEINIDKLLSKNDFLNIQLSFGLNISDNNYYNTFYIDEVDAYTISTFIIDSYGYIDGLRLINKLKNTYNSEWTTVAKSWYISNNEKRFDRDYKITSIDFSVPVFYSIKNLMISGTAYIIVPISKNYFYDQYTSFMYTFGASYFFEL